MYKNKSIFVLYFTLSPYPIYSSLFSSVTSKFDPPDFSSCEVTFPSSSMSTQKYISKLHSSILLSLREKVKKKRLTKYVHFILAQKTVNIRKDLQTLSKLENYKTQCQ